MIFRDICTIIVRAACLLERLQNLTNVIYFWTVWHKSCVWTRHLFWGRPGFFVLNWSFQTLKVKPGNSRRGVVTLENPMAEQISAVLSDFYVRTTERNGDFLHLFLSRFKSR